MGKENSAEARLQWLSLYFSYIFEHRRAADTETKFVQLFVKNNGSMVLRKYLIGTWNAIEAISKAKGVQDGTTSPSNNLSTVVISTLDSDYPAPNPPPPPPLVPPASSFIFTLQSQQPISSGPQIDEIERNDFHHLKTSIDKETVKGHYLQYSKDRLFNLLQAVLEVMIELKPARLDISNNTKMFLRKIEETIMGHATNNLGIASEFDSKLIKIRQLAKQIQEQLNPPQVSKPSTVPRQPPVTRNPPSQTNPLPTTTNKSTAPAAVAATYNQFRNTPNSKKQTEDFSNLPELESEADTVPTPPSISQNPEETEVYKCSHNRRVTWKKDLEEVRKFSPEDFESDVGPAYSKKKSHREPRDDQNRHHSRSNGHMSPNNAAPSSQPPPQSKTQTEQFLKSQSLETQEQLRPSTLESSSVMFKPPHSASTDGHVNNNNHNHSNHTNNSSNYNHNNNSSGSNSNRRRVNIAFPTQ
jgi:hypothetical protein